MLNVKQLFAGEGGRVSRSAGALGCAACSASAVEAVLGRNGGGGVREAGRGVYGGRDVTQVCHQLSTKVLALLVQTYKY